jgi:hypothetical protein
MNAELLNNSANVVEDLKEGTLYVAENLNFRPDEHSYVEPWVEPEDPNKPKEDEKKEVPPPVDLKKMSAAEKKKYEEEQKKKAEDELTKTLSRPQADVDREIRKLKQKENEALQRKTEDYFDYKSTYNYLQNI